MGLQSVEGLGAGRQDELHARQRIGAGAARTGLGFIDSSIGCEIAAGGVAGVGFAGFGEAAGVGAVAGPAAAIGVRFAGRADVAGVGCGVDTGEVLDEVEIGDRLGLALLEVDQEVFHVIMGDQDRRFGRLLADVVELLTEVSGRIRPKLCVRWVELGVLDACPAGACRVHGQ